MNLYLFLSGDYTLEEIGVCADDAEAQEKLDAIAAEVPSKRDNLWFQAITRVDGYHIIVGEKVSE